MSTYLVVHNNGDFTSYVFAVRRDALKAAADRRYAPIGCLAWTVEGYDDLKVFSLTTMAEVFNGLSGEQIKRFSDREVGARRLLALLPTVSRQQEHIEETVVMEQVQETTKVGRRSKFADEGKIKVLAENNPKRAGSSAHDRFALYRDGMTVAEAKNAGLTGADLDYDTKHDFIKIQ